MKIEKCKIKNEKYKLLNFTIYILEFAFFIICLFSASGASAADSGNANPGGPQPPVILFPAERAELRGIYKVTFQWLAATDAASYRVMLARDRAFRNIVYENRVEDTSFTAERLEYGTYFFRISSISLDGGQGPSSDTLSFIVVPPPPASHSFK